MKEPIAEGQTNLGVGEIDLAELVDESLPADAFDAKPSDLPQGEYDVAISFVREDADLARSVASRLQEEGLKVFHGVDDDLWGVDLAEHFDGAYRSSRLCLIIASHFYWRSPWSEFETGLLTRRARTDPAYALMLVRTDDEPAPDNVAFYQMTDARSLSVDDLCAQVKARINSLPEPGPGESRSRERRVARVISRERGWAVKRDEADRALRVFDTREQAVEFSESLRDRDPCLEVVVHDSDGTVHERLPSSLVECVRSSNQFDFPRCGG